MDEMMIPMMALTIPIVVAPAAMLFKHLGKKREMEHRERMKALEMGLPATGGYAWPALVCIAIGAGVPVGTFLLAWLVMLTTHIDEEALAVPCVVGVVAVVSGVRLAGKILTRRQHEPELPLIEVDRAKPHSYDPDAYDVVGRRG